jgi:hypothetical protein
MVDKDLLNKVTDVRLGVRVGKWEWDFVVCFSSNT